MYTIYDKYFKSQEEHYVLTTISIAHNENPSLLSYKNVLKRFYQLICLFDSSCLVIKTVYIWQQMNFSNIFLQLDHNNSIQTQCKWQGLRCHKHGERKSQLNLCLGRFKLRTEDEGLVNCELICYLIQI